MKDKARLAGIFMLIIGAWDILLFIWSLLFSFYPGYSFFALGSIVYAALSAFEIITGIFSLKKKRWGWALAGAVVGGYSFAILGIPAVIFILTVRDEFQKPQPPGNVDNLSHTPIPPSSV